MSRTHETRRLAAEVASPARSRRNDREPQFLRRPRCFLGYHRLGREHARLPLKARAARVCPASNRKVNGASATRPTAGITATAGPNCPKSRTSDSCSSASSRGPGGGSALRADAQGVWLEPKPPSEHIPAAVSRLEVVETLGGKTHRASTESVNKIKAVAELLNGFPIVQRSGPTTCTAIPSEQAILRVYSAVRPGERPSPKPNRPCRKRRARRSLAIHGEEQRPLINENEALTKSLQNLLSHKFRTPLSEGVHF